MNVDDIEKEWGNDSVINKTDLMTASLNVPKLHYKYYQYLNKEQKELRKLQSYKSQMELILEQFFNRTLTDDERLEYGLPNFHDKRYLKEDIKKQIANYPDIVKCNLQILECESNIDYLKDIIKVIHNMGFQIRNAVEWVKFTNGAN